MLVKLWVFTAQNKPDGHLTNMDASDICEVMEFKGNPRLMIHALLDCTSGADSMRSCPGCDVCEKGKSKKRSAWLEKTSNGFYRVHDWEEHNPYASKAPARIDRAKKGAAARWEKKTKQLLPECSDQQQAMPQADDSNAPAPSPVPSPSPKEERGKTNISTAAPSRIDKVAFEKAEPAWKVFEDELKHSEQRFVISNPLSRKIAIDLGGRDHLLELLGQNGDRLHQEFITRYVVLESTDYRSKVPR